MFTLPSCSLCTAAPLLHHRQFEKDLLNNRGRLWECRSPRKVWKGLMQADRGRGHEWEWNMKNILPLEFFSKGVTNCSPVNWNGNSNGFMEWPCLSTPTSGGNKSHEIAIDTDSVATRATKQLLTPTSVLAFLPTALLQVIIQSPYTRWQTSCFGGACVKILSILVSKNTISGGNKRHSLVQYVTFPSTLLHSKLQVAGRQFFRLKKFAVIMHITTTYIRKWQFKIFA